MGGRLHIKVGRIPAGPELAHASRCGAFDMQPTAYKCRDVRVVYGASLENW